MAGTQPSDFTIAVVDDDPGTREVFRRILTHYDFGVKTAADGPEGLQLVLGEDIDLLILDVMMPGMDGYEVAASVRNNKPLVPIFMLTARVDPRDRMRGLMTGAHRYFTKPCSPVKVLDEVVKLLGLPPLRPRSDDAVTGAHATVSDQRSTPDEPPETVEMPAIRDEDTEPPPPSDRSR